MRRAVAGITLASREIANGNHDLGWHTESQASRLQQTAASIEQITGSVHGQAERVTQAVRILRG